MGRHGTGVGLLTGIGWDSGTRTGYSRRYARGGRRRQARGRFAGFWLARDSRVRHNVMSDEVCEEIEQRDHARVDGAAGGRRRRPGAGDWLLLASSAVGCRILTGHRGSLPHNRGGALSLHGRRRIVQTNQ